MTLERSNTNSAGLEDLSVWDFAESFTAEEALGLILGTSNHQLVALNDKKQPYQRMEKAFDAAHLQIDQAYWDADIPFEGDPTYEIADRRPLNLHSLRDHEARKNTTTQNLCQAAHEKFNQARFERAEMHRWLQAINAKSKYQFASHLPTTESQCADPIDADKVAKSIAIKDKERTSYLNIIGALLELIQAPRQGRNSAAAVIRELQDNYSDKQGFSKRNLEDVFASIMSTRRCPSSVPRDMATLCNVCSG